MNNRIIKFRVLFKNEMIHFNLGDIEETGIVWNKDHTKVACVSGNCEERHDIMQFTGLLDKNGKEIYEGDIVNAHLEFEEDYYDLIGEVGFNDGSYGIRDTTGRKWSGGYGPNLTSGCKVIGNIYEHPNLLNQ